MSPDEHGEPPDGAAPRQRRQIILNTFASVLANGWMILLTLVALPLLLHGLGSDAFGTWVLLLTFSATNGWLSLADIGLGIATVRAAAHHHSTGDEGELGAVLGTSLGLYLALAVACTVVFELVAPWLLPRLFSTPESLDGELATAIRLFGVQLLFDLLAVGIMAALEGSQRLDFARVVDSTNRTLTTAATVVVALAGGGLAGVAGASLAGSAVAFVVALVLLRRTVRVPLRLDRGTGSELIRYGSRIGVLRGAGVLHRTMDRLIVGAILGPAAVTVVEIATQLQNGAAAVLSATTQATTAGASWLRARAETDKLQELLLRGTKYSTLVTWPVSTILLVLAGPIVTIWVGSSYDAAVVPLVLAMIYLMSQTPVQVGSNLLQGTGHAGSVVGPAIAGVAVNLATSIPLVHAFGVPGAFVGTLIGGTVLTPPLLRNVLRITDLRLGRFLTESVVPVLPVALATAVGAGVVLLLPVGNLATVIVGGGAGIALATVVALRWATTATERADLLGILRRADQG